MTAQHEYEINDLVEITDVVVAGQPHGARLRDRPAVVIGFEDRSGSCHGHTWLLLAVKNFAKTVVLPPKPQFVRFLKSNQGDLVAQWKE